MEVEDGGGKERWWWFDREDINSLIPKNQWKDWGWP